MSDNLAWLITDDHPSFLPSTSWNKVYGIMRDDKLYLLLSDHHLETLFIRCSSCCQTQPIEYQLMWSVSSITS